MLTFILFAAVVGLLAGIRMQAGNTDGCGWLFLTGPMGLIMAGIPAAILFTIADASSLDPVLAWAGSWRTGLVAPVVPWVMVVRKHQQRQKYRRELNQPPRIGETLIWPLIKWALISQLLVPVWLGAKWISGAS